MRTTSLRRWHLSKDLKEDWGMQVCGGNDSRQRIHKVQKSQDRSCLMCLREYKWKRGGKCQLTFSQPLEIFHCRKPPTKRLNTVAFLKIEEAKMVVKTYTSPKIFPHDFYHSAQQCLGPCHWSLLIQKLCAKGEAQIISQVRGRRECGWIREKKRPCRILFLKHNHLRQSPNSSSLPSSRSAESEYYVGGRDLQVDKVLKKFLYSLKFEQSFLAEMMPSSRSICLYYHSLWVGKGFKGADK